MFADIYYNKQMTLSDYQSELYDILLELDARESSNNLIFEKYFKYSWNEMIALKKHCELQIELLKEN